jgi:hypothetical protein
MAVSAHYASGMSPHCLARGDFNGDGKPDLVSGDAGSGTSSSPPTLRFLINNGDGTFKDAIVVKTTDVVSSCVAADFDGDGLVDDCSAEPGRAGCSNPDGGAADMATVDMGSAAVDMYTPPDLAPPCTSGLSLCAATQQCVTACFGCTSGGVECGGFCLPGCGGGP